MRTPTAAWVAQTVEFQCPICNGDVHEPTDGSTFWTIAEVQRAKETREKVICENGHSLRLPVIRDRCFMKKVTKFSQFGFGVSGRDSSSRK